MTAADCTPTRRGLLSIAAGVGAVAMSLPASSLAATIKQMRPWDLRLADYRAALARAENFNETVYRPAWQQMVSIAGDQPPLSFTHTARSGHVATIHMTPADMDDYAAHPAYRHLASPLRDAWRTWQRNDKLAQRLVGWEAIEARQDALDAEEIRTQALLMAEPAPDHRALAVKLTIALTRVAGELQDVDRDALVADLRDLGE